MMSQWGHEAGKGLGADEARLGRSEALVMEKVPHKKKAGWGPAHSRGGEGTAVGAGAGPSKGKWTSTDPKAQVDFHHFGAPSRVVLLEGIINSYEDVHLNPDLEEEIRQEAVPLGVVEEVRLSPPTRVFVVFTGMAGAWGCVRGLDGRFFAGRKVRARYYGEEWWDRGDLWRH